MVRSDELLAPNHDRSACGTERPLLTRTTGVHNGIYKRGHAKRYAWYLCLPPHVLHGARVTFPPSFEGSVRRRPTSTEEISQTKPTLYPAGYYGSSVTPSPRSPSRPKSRKNKRGVMTAARGARRGTDETNLIERAPNNRGCVCH